MAAARPLFVGFSSASKAAREGGDLEVTVQTARGPRTFTLPWFFVRDVDALLERWRREEHEAVLLTMNDGLLGRTLVQAAQAGGLRDTVFLLASGADAAYEVQAWTALEEAAHGGHIQVVRVLLDAGAGPNDALHWALTFASGQGHTACAALLLDRGADVHFDGDSPLVEAADEGRVDTARLLLDRGADVHALNDYALRWARQGDHEAIIALLLERGAIDVEEEED